MNVKGIFSSINEWVTGLVDLLAGFIALGVLVQVSFGTGVFGVDVVSNLTGVIGGFGMLLVKNSITLIDNNVKARLLTGLCVL